MVKKCPRVSKNNTLQCHNESTFAGGNRLVDCFQPFLRRGMVSCCLLSQVLLFALLLQRCLTTPSIPRSKTSSAVRNKYLTQQDDVWNSRKIDKRGFLSATFGRKSGWGDPRYSRRKLKRHPLCRIRQVPGDGSCLFHSLSLCLRHAKNGTHWDLKNDIEDLFTYSQSLRQSAVDCLADDSRKLFVQGREWLTAKELVDIAAAQYEMTGDEYCQAMRDDTVWGGGPEIVALSNVLRRPIHVYELCVMNKQSFVLRRMACFGSPKYDGACALHVLSADSRFPDLTPGKQNPVGNHFLAVFPLKKRIRGGELIEECDSSTMDDEDCSPSVLDRVSSYLCYWWDCLAEFFDPEAMIEEGDE